VIPVETRDLDPADLDAVLDIRERSFGVLPEAQREERRRIVARDAAAGRAVGCYDGTRLVATARINAYRQWWGGRSLPMAGVVGVVVAPEYRGRGVGRRVVQGVLDRAAALGYPLSVLYPSTLPLYRDRGWELAGARYDVTVPAAAVRRLATGDVPLRRVGPDDAAEILDVVRAVHATTRSCGPLDWAEPDVREWLGTQRLYPYLAPDGFLAYRWDGDGLYVDEVIAGSGPTLRALWSLVGSGSSWVHTVRVRVPPTDALHWLTAEAVARSTIEQRWMLRLVDVPAALAGRGYPPGVAAAVALAVADPHLPGNSGTWRLTVADGAGHVAPGPASDPAAVRLGPRGLAALYAGTPLPTLRTAGLAAAGDPGADALLDTVFAARPYLLDYF
jgi:predicted acetyltransferase